MSTAPDSSFLSHLYQQDTLYLVPEDKPLAGTPMPETAAILPPAPAEVPNQNETEAISPSPETPDIVWLGEAVKGTYLLFEVAPEIFEKLPQHAFLQKVLAAVGLASLEVRFGNLSTQKNHNVKEIARQQQARHILVFGQHVPIENLQKLEPYRMYKLDETRFVRVDALVDIEQSTELKKKLWDVLQKIFLQ